MQCPGVLDDLYFYEGPLGASFSSDGVSISLWAPTAQQVPPQHSPATCQNCLRTCTAPPMALNIPPGTHAHPLTALRTPLGPCTPLLGSCTPPLGPMHIPPSALAHPLWAHAYPPLQPLHTPPLGHAHPPSGPCTTPPWAMHTPVRAYTPLCMPLGDALHDSLGNCLVSLISY